MSSNQMNSNSFYGGVSDTPLILFQPFNIIVFLSFYSPIIIAVCMVSLSFIFQNFKGFIFLGFLLGCSIIRSYIYSLNGAETIVNDRSICNSVQYSKYGNSTYSAFVFAFTSMYLFLPMFSNGGINFWMVSSMLIYFFIDIFIKIYKKCIIKMTDLILNVLSGLVSAAIIIMLMYAGGSGSYLFYNETTSSNTDVCTVPDKQTFRCHVYKNGELIA
jgi:hypothetical protein